MIIAHYKFNEDTASDNDELVTNGSAPSDLTGWTQTPGTQWSIVGNKFQGAGDSANNFLTQDFGVAVGRKYKFSYDVTANSLVGGISDNQIGLSGVGTFGLTTLSSDVATHTYYLSSIQSTTSNNELRILLASRVTGGTIDIDNISIQLLAVVDSSGNGHDGIAQQDTDQIHVAGKINGAFDFNGSSDYIDVGDTESDVKSIAIWVKPDDVTAHTDYLIDLNGTDYITIVNGTVTKNGFGTGTQIIYVDAVVASTVTTNWHLIILTSTDGFDANDLDIGRVNGSGFYGGLIDNVMLFDTILNIDDVKILHSAGHGTEILADLDESRRIQRRPIWQR